MKKKKDEKVFVVSLIIVIIFIFLSLLAQDAFRDGANLVSAFLTGKFGWFYTLTMTSMVFFCIFLAMSRWGNVVIGKDDDKPEYSRFSWFSMLFSAGMGVGLVFWGVAEPLNHWLSPLGLEPGSAEAARWAINKSVFHWSFHPWANYCVLALALGYLKFRKNKPILVSATLEPLIGEKHAQGAWGKVIDILAIVATMGGVTTSFGLGAIQASSGFNYLFGVKEGPLTYTVIIIIVTALFMTSCLVGMKAIKWFSNINVSICLFLMTIILFLGPTVDTLNTISTVTGDYISAFIRDGFAVSKDPFYGGWTIFYWSWWIAWAPFVAPFVARISKGRTIKEFIIGVMLVPTIVGILWFSIFGTVGISVGEELAREAIKSTSTALFVVLAQIPGGYFFSIVSLVLLSTFYVTSADSATYVLGMLSSEGSATPTRVKRLIWGLLQALMALGLLLAGGDDPSAVLLIIQTSSIATSFPFAIIMILCMVSIVKMLRKDHPATVRI